MCGVCASYMFVSEVCVSEVCVSEVCVSEVCVSEMCVSEVCVSEVCVSGCVCVFVVLAGAVFPFNEERVSRDGVDRNSAIIGGEHHRQSQGCKYYCQVSSTAQCTIISIEPYLYRKKCFVF